VFSTEAILDAAREVVVTRGARGATVEAIARTAGVPVGSIYHRFDSLAELLAHTWLRAARRSQERALGVPVSPAEPLASAEAVALAMYDHCLDHPQDTLLLDALGRSELLEMELGKLRGELETVNERVEALMAGLARALYGRADKRTRDLVLLALVDMPHGFAHRQLVSGMLTPARRERLAAAVGAVLAGGDGMRRGARGAAAAPTRDLAGSSQRGSAGGVPGSANSS
jgi:AcrR family transcriptional regulator